MASPVRDAFPRPQEIPAELNTAYVYLGNQQAQAGFEAAVQATTAVKNQLEGQTEKLMTRHTAAGGVVYTNNPTSEAPLVYTLGMPGSAGVPVYGRHLEDDSGHQPLPGAVVLHQEPSPAWATSLFSDAEWSLDTLAPEPASTKAPKHVKPQTHAEVLQALGENRLHAFARKCGLPTLNDRLKREDKPDFVDLSEITEAVAQGLPISDTLAQTAVSAALSRNRGKETHKELTEGATYALDVEVVTDRQSLAKEAMAALQELPHAEEEDYRIVVQTLSARLRPELDAACGNEEGAPSETERVRFARDAAHWVIRESAQELREAIFQAIANKATLVDAEPLPDVMIFPQDIGLESSAKNIYGVLPPSKEDSQDVETVLFMDERRWWVDQIFPLEDGSQFSVGRYDGALKLNTLERDFARALDGADFVLWWHRNPDKKPYAVRVVRAEHEHYFYPDFMVCIEHTVGGVPMQRLLETKESTKDAARKAKHFPAAFGKVLFLTPDGNRLRWVNDDGSLGDVVKLSEMDSVRQRLVETRPVCS